MDLSSQWCTHHRNPDQAHFLIGPYGRQEPLGYGTLCGSLSGARGWHREHRVDRRCSRCQNRIATQVAASAPDDQPTARAAQEFWNSLEFSERNALINGTAVYDGALLEKLAFAGMVLTPVETSDDPEVVAHESSPSLADAPELPPSLFLARELILIIDRGDPGPVRLSE